jgi:hypothetical protein
VINVIPGWLEELLFQETWSEGDERRVLDASQEIRRCVAETSNYGGILVDLSYDCVDDVRHAVTKNPFTPKVVLARMAQTDPSVVVRESAQLAIKEVEY